MHKEYPAVDQVSLLRRTGVAQAQASEPRARFARTSPLMHQKGPEREIERERQFKTEK